MRSRHSQTIQFFRLVQTLGQIDYVDDGVRLPKGALL